MGLGDVALAPLLGFVLGWLGWGVTLTGLLAGFVLGAGVGLGLLAFAGASRRARVTHVPFMLAGAAFAVVVAAHMCQGYLQVTVISSLFAPSPTGSAAHSSCLVAVSTRTTLCTRPSREPQ